MNRIRSRCHLQPTVVVASFHMETCNERRRVIDSYVILTNGIFGESEIAQPGVCAAAIMLPLQNRESKKIPGLLTLFKKIFFSFILKLKMSRAYSSFPFHRGICWGFFIPKKSEEQLTAESWEEKATERTNGGKGGISYTPPF